jgi:hypothetical protein
VSLFFDDYGFIRFWVFLAGILLATFVLSYGVMFIAGRVDLHGDLAKIERVRVDVRNIDLNASEDAYGIAMAWNQKIVSKQAYNRVWYLDPLIPDEWDAVELIEVRR